MRYDYQIVEEDDWVVLKQFYALGIVMSVTRNKRHNVLEVRVRTLNDGGVQYVFDSKSELRCITKLLRPNPILLLKELLK